MTTEVGDDLTFKRKLVAQEELFNNDAERDNNDIVQQVPKVLNVLRVLRVGRLCSGKFKNTFEGQVGTC